MVSCRTSSSGSSVGDGAVPRLAGGGTAEVAEVSSVEERIPENVVVTSMGHLGYSIGMSFDGVLRDLDVLSEYFTRCEGAYSAAGLFEFAKSKKLSPMLLWKGFSLLVKYEMPATLEMYELWSAYSISYLGDVDGERYISDELGCPAASASERDRLAVFTPKRQRK